MIRYVPQLLFYTRYSNAIPGTLAFFCEASQQVDFEKLNRDLDALLLALAFRADDGLSEADTPRCGLASSSTLELFQLEACKVVVGLHVDDVRNEVDPPSSSVHASSADLEEGNYPTKVEGVGTRVLRRGTVCVPFPALSRT